MEEIEETESSFIWRTQKLNWGGYLEVLKGLYEFFKFNYVCSHDIEGEKNRRRGGWIVFTFSSFSPT